MSVTAILRDANGSYLKDDKGHVRIFLLPGHEPPTNFDLPSLPQLDKAPLIPPPVAQLRRFVNTGIYEGDALIYQEAVSA